MRKRSGLFEKSSKQKRQNELPLSGIPSSRKAKATATFPFVMPSNYSLDRARKMWIKQCLCTAMWITLARKRYFSTKAVDNFVIDCISTWFYTQYATRKAQLSTLIHNNKRRLSTQIKKEAPLQLSPPGRELTCLKKQDNWIFHFSFFVFHLHPSPMQKKWRIVCFFGSFCVSSRDISVA